MPKAKGPQSKSPSKPPRPNDNRANVKNPNNVANKAAMTNNANQKNPNNAAYRASRGGEKGRGK